METLRQIPPVNDVLRSPELAEFRGILSLPIVTAVISEVFSDLRQELSNSKNGVSRTELTAELAAEAARRLRLTLSLSLRRVINASGVVLHTNLGRAPLPEAAIEHLRAVSAGYSNLEFDIEKGQRGKRDVHAGRAIQRLLGCESALVVNNNAAAVFLALNTLGEGGEVIVSRGEEVEIGESFRIPDIIARSGARVCEVGTTNRTRISDYENAITGGTRLLLRVHPSNFRITGFTERPSLEQFAELGRRRGIPTYEDQGSGCMMDMESIGISGEPSPASSVRTGIDIVSFSGDKILGGPQAGIIAGKKIYIERLRRNPLFRALRVDKLTLSVLDYVVRAYLRNDLDSIPVSKMLRTPQAELRRRAEAFSQRAGPHASPIELKSVPGGGSAPGAELTSWGVALEFSGVAPSKVEQQLRLSNPPVIARIEAGRVILDFRTVFESEEDQLLKIVCGLSTL
jgi:L-seryl-tRNA(Ser) seleniumtransferase